MDCNTEVLNSQLGTYTRNATAADVPLCPLCRTELAPDSSHCCSCQRLLAVPGAVPDRVGFGIYAVGGQQTGYMMRNYKNGVLNRDYGQVRALLAEMLQHNACLAALSGTPISAITYIPSLSHPSHRYHALAHILGDMVRALPALAGLTRLHLRPTTVPHQAHQIAGSGSLTVKEGNGEWGHVLVVDDTWTTGASVGDATLTLRAAGAAMVSSLLVARWINEKYSRALTASLVRRKTFDSRTCPWTPSGQCPPPGPHPAGGR